MPNRYPRPPWKGNERVIIHGSLDALRGGREKFSDDYRTAKGSDDVQTASEAAERVVSECIDPKKMAMLIGTLRTLNLRTLNIVVPYRKPDEAEFRGNAIGFTFAKITQRFLKRHLPGVDVRFATNIVQTEKVGRTNLSPQGRFVHQARFAGDVNAGEHYLIVDDVFTSGGTFAQLRAHIIRGKGTFVGGMALAYANGDKVELDLPAAKRQLNDLKRRFGNGIGPFWKREFGHDLECLTYGEAKRLLDIGKDLETSGPDGTLIDALRDQFRSA